MSPQKGCLTLCMFISREKVIQSVMSLKICRKFVVKRKKLLHHYEVFLIQYNGTLIKTVKSLNYLLRRLEIKD